ncbi:hypothetical protein [Streptomyces sp. NPDC057877]
MPLTGGLPPETDLVFSDGYERRLATVTDGPGDGYTATLTVPV